MRIRSQLITSLAALLFLASTVKAQDEKDAVIRILEKKLEIQKIEFEQKLKLLEITLKQHQVLHDRLKEEIAAVTKAAVDREKLILKLESDFKAAHDKAIEMEQIAKSRQAQNEKLLAQIRELTAKLIRLEAGAEPPPKKLVEANPPGIAMKGMITKVDGKLIQIDLGKDHGLNENHTLEVIRLSPAPKYLGMIRIVSVENQTAIGRVVGGKAELKEGDQVMSRLK